MYWFDPERGRRRRTLVRDQLHHAVRGAQDFFERGLRDLGNRLDGLVHDARCLITPDHPDDRTIVQRVRSKMGRYVSHPGAVEVRSDGGQVTLRGPILARDAEAFLGAVKQVRGVRGVENQLEVHDQPGTISSLQQGIQRPGGKPFDMLQENWAPATRLLTSGLGAGLLLHTLVRRSPGSLLLGTLGAGLILRATGNLSARQLTGKSYLETGKLPHDVREKMEHAGQ